MNLEEECTEIMAENTRKKGFFPKISSQTEGHKHNWTEYADFSHLA